MIQEFNLISNNTWNYHFSRLLKAKTDCENYREDSPCMYSFNPVKDHVFTATSNMFDLKKAAAMYFWYMNGDRSDTFITKYFDEYKHCIDNNHTEFNSNYGYYAFTEGGLDRCISYLMRDVDTRQACFCINNNEAMDFWSIDKLCTNTIQFFIRKNKLNMVVQMRSSNFLTLLPYDAFMFSVFYQLVYSSLRSNKYYDLETGMIHMQVASLHMFMSDLDKYNKLERGETILIEDFTDSNWRIELEKKLLKALNN